MIIGALVIGIGAWLVVLAYYAHTTIADALRIKLECAAIEIRHAREANDEAWQEVEHLESRLTLTNRQLAERVLERDEALRQLPGQSMIMGEDKTRAIPPTTNREVMGLEPLDDEPTATESFTVTFLRQADSWYGCPQ